MWWVSIKLVEKIRNITNVTKIHSKCLNNKAVYSCVVIWL